jgi:hypothetical protein
MEAVWIGEPGRLADKDRGLWTLRREFESRPGYYLRALVGVCTPSVGGFAGFLLVFWFAFGVWRVYWVSFIGSLVLFSYCLDTVLLGLCAGFVREVFFIVVVWLCVALRTGPVGVFWSLFV